MTALFKTIFLNLAFLFLFVNPGLRAQCLSGNYIIDPNASAYKSITEALDSLTQRGICGNVTFKISPGVYNEQLVFPSINRTGANQTVTFTSLTGLAYDVVIQYPSSSASTNNYVLLFNSGNYFKLDRLSIKRTGTQSYSQVIQLTNNSSNNIFSHNIISSDVVNTSFNSALVYSGSTIDTANTFISNTFTKGSYGLFLSGQSPNFESSNSIQNNVFDGQAISGVSMYNQSSPEISGNNFKNSSNSSSYNCIYLSNCKNKISITKNEVKALGTNLTNGSGIGLSSCIGSSDALIANNMVVIYGSSNSGAIYFYNCSSFKIINNTLSAGINAIYVSNGTQLKLLNNIIISNQYCINFAGTSNSISQSDYNVFYTNYAVVSYPSVVYTSLPKWSNATSNDLHSKFFYPSFISNTNLRVINDVDLYHAGIYDPLVPTDIDGDVRSATPDIGADEYSLFKNSAAIYKVLLPIHSVCEGFNTAGIVIRNQGENDLTNLQVNCFKDKQLYNSFSWTGLLHTGEFDTVDVATINFKRDSVYDIQIKIGLPNSETDPFGKDDSTSVMRTYTKMQGVYRIGGNNPEYSSFTSAINDLILRGVCGPVVFKVRNQLYREQLTITSIQGTSAINTIVFEPESTTPNIALLYDMQQFSSSPDFCVKISNASFITFKNIKFTSYYPSLGFSAPMVNINYSKNIKFINNYFEGKYASVFSGGTACDSLFIEGNIFDKGTYIIDFSNYGKYLMIKNNTFRNFTNQAIKLINAASVHIINNSIKNNSLSNICFLSQCTDSLVIQNNIIQCLGPSIAIQINACNTIGYIVNNYIDIKSGEGIDMEGSHSYKIYNNTVKVNGDQSSFPLRMYLCSGIDMKNNIFINYGPALAFNFYNSSFQSNYNCFYSNGTLLVNNYSNLSSYINTEQKDFNSIAYLPTFVSPDDFHLTKGSLVINKGIAITGVSKDLDGEPRTTIPDMGADEAAAVYSDLTILSMNKGTVTCNDNPSVVASVKNVGADTIYRFQIQWKVNKLVQTAYSGNEKIAPGQTKNIKLGDYLFKYKNNYQIKSWIVCNADTIHTNDTLTTASFTTAMGGAYTIGGDDPDFITLHAAIDAVKTMGVCSPVQLLIRDGIYDEFLLSPSDSNYAIIIPEIPGASPINNLVLESESKDTSKVTLITDSNYGVIGCHGVDYLTIQHLSLISIDPRFSERTLNIAWGSEYLRILKNKISDGIHSDPNPYPNNHILIEGNRIIRQGLEMNADYNYYMGYETGNVVRNNTFEAIGSYGVNAFYQEDLIIENNTFRTNYKLTSEGPGLGLYLEKCNGEVKIRNNKFLNCVGYATIYLDSCIGTTSNPILLANNFILNNNGTAPISSIDNYLCSNIDIIHNTIVRYYPNSYINNGSCISGSGSGLNLLNNIFVNLGKGPCLNLNPKLVSKSDYNLFWGDTTILLGYTSNLAQWQSNGKDLHSIVREPRFIFEIPNAVDKTDLHLDPSQATPYRSSILYPGLDKDIDGDSRNLLRPVMGADEYTPTIISTDHTPASGRITQLLLDKNLCTGLKRIVVKVENKSSVIIGECSIHLIINDTMTIDKSMNVSILPNDYMGVELGTYPFPAAGVYTIKASLTSINFNAYADPSGYTQTFTLSPNPTADFNYTSIPGNLSFQNNSKGAISYLWDFGNGTTSTSSSPSCNYSDVGNYFVKLDAIASCATSSILDTIYVDVFPDIRPSLLETSPSCASVMNVDVIVMNLNHKTVRSFVVNWSIDGILQTPIVNDSVVLGPMEGRVIPLKKLTFAQPTQLFKVWTSLPNSVTDANTANDTLVEILSSSVTPVPNFTYTLTGTNTVSFSDKSVNAFYYYWDFGDNTYSLERNPTHTFSADQSSYWVNLYTGNNCGSTGASKTINLVNGIMDSEDHLGKVYPVPSPGIVYFSNDHDLDMLYEFTITNTFGETIVTGSKMMDGNPLSFDLRPYPSGIYFLNVKRGEQSKIYKMVKL